MCVDRRDFLNETRLAVGIRYSDEPVSTTPGTFGLGLEDCHYLTKLGAKLLTTQSPSIDQPFG
jgi:Xaa-Pro dipeptidase